jgi:glutamate dehydrogenase/leucine dehydrogenase
MDVTLKGIGDDLGPAKVLCLRQTKSNFEAYVVIDNVACGPALGGIRMAADVTLTEVARLARAIQ